MAEPSMASPKEREIVRHGVVNASSFVLRSSSSTSDARASATLRAARLVEPHEMDTRARALANLAVARPQ